MKKIEFDLQKYARAVWNDRKKMCLYCFVSGCIGVLLAFTTPKEYKASVLLAPESTTNNLSSNISSLASMVGIGLNFNSDDAIFPELYPDLIQSADFTIDLFDVPVTTSKGDTHTYFEHITKYRSNALWEWPMVGLTKLLEAVMPKGNVTSTKRDANGTLWISRQQEKAIKNISKIIDCQVDKKTEVISISVTDQDAFVAACITDTVKQHLQNAITDYRTRKARIDLNYFEEIFAEAKRSYMDARVRYAEFLDTNNDLIMQTVRVKEEQLKTEVELAEAVYTQASEQLQLAKAKVQEKTPAFCVIQSAYVPSRHTNTPKVVTLALFIFLGFALRSLLLWKKYLTIK